MIYEQLITRDIKDLRILAAQYGIKTHHKAKTETVAKLIVEHIATPPVKPVDALKHVAEAPKPALVIHSEEAVRELLAKYLEKEAFTLTFPGDDTLIMRCRGCEESIHMSALLRVIKLKADTVSRGARKPFMVKNTDGNEVMMAGI